MRLRETNKEMEYVIEILLTLLQSLFLREIREIKREREGNIENNRREKERVAENNRK